MTSKDINHQRLSASNDRSEEAPDPLQINEAEIWLQFKNGDEKAFVWIYHHYFDILFNYAMQFDLERSLVKDQIQDLFIYIRSHRTRLADVKSIKYYLFKSLRRKLLSNKKGKFSMLSIFTQRDQKPFEIQVTDSPEVKMINQSLDEEKNAALSKAMSKLTARQKEGVLHFYYEGLSYQQIADVMELKNVKSARKLIYRAIDALREDLNRFKEHFY